MTSALPEGLAQTVKNTPILVVGAGGIGCELLKNLVLTGFSQITIIDLDTIDYSNLNRQFLFQKRHVGRPKSEVARESALEIAPSANIEAIHDSITKPLYGLSYYQKFAIVFNALDNRAARSHVNRMCLAANVPLVESGTAGYLGQVTVIMKNETECYDCEPKAAQKSFPGCTIRNTPSEPIHCIVWSKHLFNQLFGESDPDEEVSPDSEDPEASAKSADPEATENTNEKGDAAIEANNGNVIRISTRQWAIDSHYDPKLIFQKLFHDDIKYLLSMDKLWAKRRPPVPLDWDNLPGPKSDTINVGIIRDQQMWTLSHCVEIFADSVKKLSASFAESDYKNPLVWDKDDEPAMDFVASCANIRSHIFGIAQKSRFDIKSMAGNIIPAIATTNAVIAGCIVMEGLKILNNQKDRCKTTYLSKKLNPRGKVLIPCHLNKPNPKCYVCSEKREVTVKVRVDKMTVKLFEEKVLKGSLHVVAPDLEIDGRGIIIISSDNDDDTKENNEKTLLDMGVTDGSILSCDDFVQDYNVKIIILNDDKLEEHDFELIARPEDLNVKNDEASDSTEAKKDEAATSSAAVEADDDIVEVSAESRKRRASANDGPVVTDSNSNSNDIEIVDNAGDDIIEVIPSKKAKLSTEPEENKPEIDDDDEDIVCLD